MINMMFMFEECFEFFYTVNILYIQKSKLTNNNSFIIEKALKI